MAAGNSLSYICTRALHSFRSFAHWRAASAVIPLLPKATFTPSIQPNLGLPRTRPPLTSAFITLLAIRCSYILTTWFDDRLGSMIYADVLSTSSRRLNFGGPVIALGLIGKSLFAVKSKLMKYTRRPSISLVSETSMFSWTSSPLISGGPFLSQLCSTLVRHCLPWSVRVGDWCVSRLERLICCQIILTASSPGSLLICWSLAIRLLV